MPLQPFRGVPQVDPGNYGMGALQNIQVAKQNALLNIGAQKKIDEYDANAPVREAKRNNELDSALFESLQIASKMILPDIKAGNPEGVRSKLVQRRMALDQRKINTTETDEAIGIVDRYIANPDDPAAQNEYAQFAVIANDFATVSDKVNQANRKGYSKGAGGRYRYTDAEGNDQNGTGVEVFNGDTSETELRIIGPDGLLVPNATNIRALNDLDQTADEAANAAVSQAGRERAAEKSAEIAAIPEQVKAQDFADRKKLAGINIRKLLSQKQSFNNLFGKVTSAFKNTNYFTVGAGGLLSILPNTDALAMKQDLASILSDVAFDRLQKMRDNSPTGGALGQVSNFEIDLLKASLTGINQLTDPDKFKAALLEIRQFYKNLNYLNDLNIEIEKQVKGAVTQDQIDEIEATALQKYEDRLSKQGRQIENDWESVYGASGRTLGSGEASSTREAIRRLTGINEPETGQGASSEIDAIAEKYRNP